MCVRPRPDKPIGKPFENGHAKVGGRVKGARNKLSADFLSALSEAFEARGREAIEIVITENPEKFLSVIASVLPKEFEINDNRLKEIPDDQLDSFIEFARQHLADGARKLDGRKDEATH